MSAPLAYLLRFDQAPPALEGLARPVRRESAAEPGVVIYEGYAAIEGVQPYPDIRQGAGYAELVTVEALEASAAVLPGLPVIMGQVRNADGVLVHPGQDTGRLELVTTENGDRIPKRGTVLAAEVRALGDGMDEAYRGLRALWVQVAVFDAFAIEAIDAKRANATSLAYRPVLDQTPGTWRGIPYTAAQIGRGPHNHLLLTNKGRGGPLCELRADALGESMTPEQIAALVAALKPEILAAVKQALQEARVEDQAAWITDDSALAMAKAIARVKAEGEQAIVQGDAPAETVLKAEMDAMRTRCEAAEAEVAALKGAQEKAKLKADAAPLAAALQRHNLRVDAFKADAPTKEGNEAARAALLAAALRGDAAPARSPLDQPLQAPAAGADPVPTDSPRFAKLA